MGAASILDTFTTATISLQWQRGVIFHFMLSLTVKSLKISFWLLRFIFEILFTRGNFKGKQIHHLTSLSLSWRLQSVKEPSIHWQTLLSVFWRGLNGYIWVSTKLGKCKKTSTSEFFQLEQLFEEADCPILKRHLSILWEPCIRIHFNSKRRRLVEKLFFKFFINYYGLYLDFSWFPYMKNLTALC